MTNDPNQPSVEPETTEYLIDFESDTPLRMCPTSRAALDDDETCESCQ